MQITIMGAGGIGGYLGARLAQSGEDVTFIARGAHLDAMRTHGLHLQSPRGNVYLPLVKATDAPIDVGATDVVIVAVKLYDLEKAAAAIVPLVGPLTRVIAIQNGIDSVDLLSRFVLRLQVVAGATYLSAYLERPGLIVHAGHRTTTTLGGRGDSGIEAFRAACLRRGH